MRFITIAALAVLFALPAMAQEKPQAPQGEPSLVLSHDTRGGANSRLIKDAPNMGDHVMGKEDAPVLLIEYVSMTCPHCARFSNVVLPEIEKRYIEAGKVRYILRQFPLNEPALKAAMLLDCVGEQNNEKYFQFARVMFDAQRKWAFDGNFMEGLETIAAVGGVSREQFLKCTNDTDREMRLLKAKKQANDELKIPHTPYIFIGGEIYEGDRSVEAVSKFIDAKLAQIEQKK